MVKGLTAADGRIEPGVTVPGRAEDMVSEDLSAIRPGLLSGRSSAGVSPGSAPSIPPPGNRLGASPGDRQG